MTAEGINKPLELLEELDELEFELDELELELELDELVEELEELADELDEALPAGGAPDPPHAAKTNNPLNSTHLVLSNPELTRRFLSDFSSRIMGLPLLFAEPMYS